MRRARGEFSQVGMAGPYPMGKLSVEEQEVVMEPRKGAINEVAIKIFLEGTKLCPVLSKVLFLQQGNIWTTLALRPDCCRAYMP